MTTARNGDTVRVHYTGKLPDGKVLGGSTDREPVAFTIGDGKVLPGLEQAVVGMSPGDSKTIVVPSDKAYGPRREDKVMAVDRHQLPKDLDPQVGQRLALQLQNGSTVPVRVTGATDSRVELDANHPLAGKDLVFDIELVEVV
jgi:peptidylprolyl isomerase